MMRVFAFSVSVLFGRALGAFGVTVGKALDRAWVEPWMLGHPIPCCRRARCSDGLRCSVPGRGERAGEDRHRHYIPGCGPGHACTGSVHRSA